MEKHILSKSTFLRGLQCHKSLYLYKNFIQLRDAPSAEQQAIFNRGNNVGLFAQKLFPGGTDATPAKRSDNMAAVLRTQELLRSGCEVIYEAAFQFEQVLAILDILVKKDGVWHAYEVKSSTKISHTYLLDASLQYWVITNAGIPLEDISLITINNQYVRHGGIDPQGLFAVRSVKKEALANQDMVSGNIEAAKKVATSAAMPQQPIGEHCFSPYTCDFMRNCWKQVPKDSVFGITGLSKAGQFALYNAGYRTISEIPEENELDKNVNMHIRAVKSGTPVIDRFAVAEFLKKVQYPVYFMDFETFMPAIPVFEGTRPYQHLPFQYSLHYKKGKNGTLEHFEFLAEQGGDPRRTFAENLLKHTEEKGTILVFDALMERNVLNGLKKDFPELAVKIEERLSRIIDLMTPFQEKSYYHPAMKNSFSIKNLLPAIAPELSYSGLQISSGSIAMIAYEKLASETDMFKIQEVKEQLLEYCRMDTLAMVKVFEVLENSI